MDPAGVVIVISRLKVTEGERQRVCRWSRGHAVYQMRRIKRRKERKKKGATVERSPPPAASVV